MNQKGFVNIVLIVLVVALTGVTGYFILRKDKLPYKPQAQITGGQPDNNNGGTSLVNTTGWKSYTNSVGPGKISLMYPPTTAPYIQIGFAYPPLLIVNKMRNNFGYPTKTDYADLSDFINDIKSKPNNGIVSIIGDIVVGDKKGWEISLNGKAGVWVELYGNLYTFYFDKERLTDTDRQILLTVNFAEAIYSVSSQTPPSTSETANWKVYRNENYGFEFRYPPTYTTKTENNGRDTIVFGSDELTFGVFVPSESGGLGANEHNLRFSGNGVLFKQILSTFKFLN